MKVSRISASLVLFHNDPAQYGLAMQSFLEGVPQGILFVVDNSAQPLQHPLFSHPRVRYVHAGRNLGFGAGHNVAIARLGGLSDLHLLLNPDIRFGPDVLPALAAQMARQPDIGALMPQVIYPDGELQRLTKLLPTPVDLILRRFIPSEATRERINRRYELHGLPQDRPSDVPSLSGCFLLVRTDLLVSLGGFDERYFMYMEDVDLVRRIGDGARTVYDPSVRVVHDYAKGSYRNRKLLGYHLRSALSYFTKWGWLFDGERTRRNRRVLDLLRHQPAQDGKVASGNRP